MNTMLSALEQTRQRLVSMLWEVGAFSVSEFSPLRFNLRTPNNRELGPLTGRIVDLGARCMKGLWIGLMFDAVAPASEAGEPFAQMLAELGGRVPCLPTEKKIGFLKQNIASVLKSTPRSVSKVLVVDDIRINSTTIEVINLLRRMDLEVTDATFLVDPNDAGRRYIDEWDCHIQSVFSTFDLLDISVDLGRITEQDDIRIRADFAQAA